MPSLKDHIAQVIERRDLDRASAAEAMDAIMSGEATGAQIGAFLIAMRMKGETAEEIAGFASIMRQKATRVAAAGAVIDTCGTGGDTKGTFNISTAAALVAAGAGATVAKHGNRSVSSSSGSADVLKSLGVKIDCDVATVEACIAEARIGFLFAPMLHAAMKHAIGPRREIGVRTFFNVLGPLTNPAGAQRQVLGVFDTAIVEKIARVLALLGTERAMVVAGEDGLDELSTTAPSRVARVDGQRVTVSTLDAQPLGLPRARIDDLKVAGPDESARVVREVLAGSPGPRRDIVLLNAAAALIVAGIEESWAGGLKRAAAAIDSGAAAATLQKLVDTSNRNA